jgi:cyclophilin family peptidyl-prolyl cis-trans isomerase
MTVFRRMPILKDGHLGEFFSIGTDTMKYRFRNRRRNRQAKTSVLRHRGIRRFSRSADGSPFERLEPRLMLHGAPGSHDHPPEYDPATNFTIHADLSIYVESAPLTIPANVGQGIVTNNADGRIEFTGPQSALVTLGDFFDSWEQSPQPGSPSTIVLTDTQLFDNVVNSQNTLQMFVNGFKIEDDLAGYEVHDEDDIVLIYGSNPVVTINTNFESALPATINGQPVRGILPVELRVDAAPGTVANFLNYANDGDYDNAIFHRYDDNFVLQGGGFSTTSPTFVSAAQLSDIPSDPPIQNEYQVSNTALTIAVAKLGGNPNSGTNEWFINLANNTGNLDNQNGGFTVFARVLDPSVLNTVTGFTTTMAGGAFGELPLGEGSQLAVIESIEGVGTVRGVKFEDLNNNSARDTGELGLANFTIYSDINGNNQLDAEEPSTVTAADGSYFLEVPGGQQHTIREVPMAPFAQTFPVNPDEYTILVHINGDVPGLDFGNTQLSEPTSIDLLVESDSGSNNSDDLTNFNNSSPARAPLFRIAGVTAGETVRLRIDGVVVAEQAAATGGVIQLDGVNTVADGQHQVTATRVINGTESSVVSMTVTIDGTSPVFSSQPPTTATVDETFTYDAASSEEGDAGFLYSLNDAQTGATVNPALGIVINSLTGSVTWTPGVTNLGDNSFTVVATDLAGNATAQPLDINVSRVDIVQLRLQVVDASGNPTSTVDVGDSFQLQALVLDIRDTADGVFSAYTDITFDPDLVRVTDVTHGESYGQGAKPNFLRDPPDTIDTVLTAPGLLDEVGSFAASIAPLGPSERLLMSVDLEATASGTFMFMTDPADLTSVHQFGLYNRNGAVPNDQIDFGTTSLTILSNFMALNPSIGPDEDSVGTSLPIEDLAEFNSGFSGDLTIVSVDQPTNGQVTVAGDAKSLTYVPNGDFFGLDPFDYTVTDGVDNGKGTVDVAVQPVNDPPVAVDDTYQDQINGAAFEIVEDSQDNFLPVLNNDTSGPDEPNTEELFVNTFPATSAQGAVLALTSNGRGISYTPPANFRGGDTLTYTTRDDQGAVSGEAMVTVNVIEFNDPPTAVNDSEIVLEDSAETLIDVLANDSTAPDDGEVLTITNVTSPNGSTIRITNNMIGYRPATDFSGLDTFTYTISDGNGGTAEGTVRVTVTNVNDPPTAVDDSGPLFRVTQNSSANSLDVRANDTASPDTGEELRVVAISGVSAGASATIAPGGMSVLYTPPAGFLGTDTFTYTLSDGNGLTDTATVSVQSVEFTPGSLSGFVYVDANNNGIKDAEERGLAGVTVTLNGIDPSGDENRTAMTDANGFYEFMNLAPGNYVVRQTQPDENIDNDGIPVLDGIDTIGSQGGTVSGNDEFTITLAEGVDGSANNFGEVKGRSLNGGFFDSAVQPLAFGNIGVDIFGGDGDDPLIRSVFTKADGTFNVDGLAPDTYSVVAVSPSFLHQSVDRLSATIEDADSTGNNFNSAVRMASTLSYRDFVAFRARSAAHAAVPAGGEREWYALDTIGWSGVTDVGVSLTEDRSMVTLQITDAAGNTEVGDIPTSHPQVHVLSAASDGLNLIRFDGDRASFNHLLAASTMDMPAEGERPVVVSEAITVSASVPNSLLDTVPEGEGTGAELSTNLLIDTSAANLSGTTVVTTLESADLQHQNAVDAVHPAEDEESDFSEILDALVSSSTTNQLDLLSAVDEVMGSGLT